MKFFTVMVDQLYIAICLLRTYTFTNDYEKVIILFIGVRA